MTHAQPVMSRCAKSNALLAVAIDSRYLETRQKALELFAKCGFSRVSMRDLATYLGIKAGSIYNHIESKEALLFELIEELYEQLLHGASLVTRRKSAPAVRLQGLLEAHLLLHERMGAHFRLAEYDLHCLSSEQHASILSLRRRYEEHLVETIEQLTGTTGQRHPTRHLERHRFPAEPTAGLGCGATGKQGSAPQIVA